MDTRRSCGAPRRRARARRTRECQIGGMLEVALFGLGAERTQLRERTPREQTAAEGAGRIADRRRHLDQRAGARVALELPARIAAQLTRIVSLTEMERI